MPSGVYMYSPFIPSWFLPLYQEGKGELYNTIGVGLSALFVSTNRAMREPLECGTSNKYSSHAFLFIDLSVQGHVGELFDNQMKINKQLYQLLYSHLNLAIIMRIKRISFLCSFIIFFSTMFIGCGRKKQQNIPVNATVKSFNPISVNIYIENSGSMAGYCNMRDISAMETLIGDYYDRLISSTEIKNVTLNFINTSISRINLNKKDFLSSIKSKCTAQYTKLDEMLEMMMDSVSNDCVNILISDYVFTTNLGNLAIAASDITSQFHKQLINKDFAIAIYKYMVNFNGRYYPGGLKCNKPLPLYVWAFGSKENIRKITRLPLDSKNCGTYFLHKPCNVPYKLNGKSSRMIKNNEILVSKWEKDVREDFFEFEFETTLDNLLLKEEDLQNISNYIISSNTSTQYIIKSIDRIGEDNYKFTIRTNGSKPSPGELKIFYPIIIPEWVVKSNYMGNGIPADSTTYGISYLINGVSKAFKDASENDNNYFTINIKLK